jgi:hypothetical protein
MNYSFFSIRILSILGIIILCHGYVGATSIAESNTTLDGPSVCDITITVPDDITICGDSEVALNGIINGTYDDFVWCEDGSDTSYDLDEVIDVDQTTTFTLKATFYSDENIIVNGDFESGDSGFTTDYIPGQGNCTHGAGFLGCEGTYNVIDDPSLGHTNFDPCDDNSGGGNMMVVNGAASLQEIWCQDVCIDPEGTYVFNAYATSVNPSSPAQLQFAIDGSLIGNLFSLSGSTCSWEFFEAEWEASGETTIEICVTNQNTAAGGNDFALDDIGFFTVCKEEMSFDVTVTDFEIETFDPEDLDCNTTETIVEIDIDPIATYDMEWSTDDGNIVDIIDDGYSILVDMAGEYYVTVTDENGCTREEEIEVYSDVEPLEVDVIVENILDCDNPETEVYVESGNNDLIFSWYDEDDELISTEDVLEIAAPGTYSLIATDEDTGCGVTEFFEVLQDTISPTFIISKSSDIDCNNAVPTISIDTISSEVNWTVPNGYPMNNPLPTTSQIEAIVAGTYIAELESDNGCTHQEEIEILEINPKFDYSILSDSFIDCNIPFATVSIDIDTSELSINWISLPTAYNDSLSFSLNQAGTYLFTIQDSVGCIISDSILIIEDTNLPAPINVLSTEITCNEPISTITANNPNGYTITWQESNGLGGIGDTYQSSEVGPVSYTLTGDNGCTYTDLTTISASDDIPIISIIGDTLNCENTTVQLSITSDQPIVEYSWSDSGQNNISNDASLVVTDPGVYSIEVLSNTGCRVMADYQVQIDTVAATIILPDEITLDCTMSTFSTTVDIDSRLSTLDYTGDWLNESDGTVIFSDAGTYTVTVTSDNGCSSIASTDVRIDTSELAIQIISDTLLNCNIDSIEASFIISNNYSHIEWNGFNTQSTDSILTITSPGTYTLLVTGENGCISTREHIITQDLLPPTFMASATEINCAFPLTTILIDSSDPIQSIIYTDDDGNELGNGNGFQTDYTDNILISVTGTNGCMAEVDISAQVDLDNFDFNIISDTLSCNQDAVTIQFVDNLNYTEAIILNATGDIIGDITTDITEAGTYTVELTLDNGCTSTSTIDIIEDISKVDFTVEDIELNCQRDEEAIIVDIIGNYLNIELIDAAGNIIGDENNLITETGVYSLIVYNENNCPNTKTFSVSKSSDSPRLDNFSAIQLICEESLDLRINNISGGVPPYTITVDGNSIIAINESNIITGAGDHEIHIEDSNGCTLDTFITISPIIPVSIEPIRDITITAGESAQLNLIINKDINEIVEIQWKEENFLSCYDCLNPTFSGDSSITYQVTVTDINGCTANTEVRLIVNQIIRYYVPNVIHLTNSNSRESRFTIFSLQDDIVIIQDLSIYDRWGNQVFENLNFEANDPSLGWDGYFNNGPVEQGVYVYYSLIELANGEVVKLAGDVTVLR